jgi:hypothetical protein
MDFKLVSTYKPQGDQAAAIQALTRGIFDREQHQVLLGVTGSGKTFTMSSKASSLTTPSNISSPTTTTTSPKLTYPPPISTSKKKPRSTMNSTSCVSPPRAHYSNAETP